MGLNAVVFKSIHKLESEYGLGLFDVNNTTGEAVLKPEHQVRIPRMAFFAVQKRLGNLSEVERLRDIVGKLLPNRKSLIQERVLYSAFHSGDTIEQDNLFTLEEEIALL